MASDWFNIFNNSYLGQFQPSGEFKRPELGRIVFLILITPMVLIWSGGVRTKTRRQNRDSQNSLIGKFAPQGMPFTFGATNPIGSPYSQGGASADRFRQLMGLANTGGNFGSNMAAAGAGTGVANILQKLLSERPLTLPLVVGRLLQQRGVPLDEFGVGTVSDKLTSGDFTPSPATALSFLPMAGRAVGGETGTAVGQGAKLAGEVGMAIAQPEVGRSDVGS